MANAIGHNNVAWSSGPLPVSSHFAGLHGPSISGSSGHNPYPTGSGKPGFAAYTLSLKSLPQLGGASSSQFDLGSSHANILLGADILSRGQSVTINLGGTAKSFSQGSLVTAGEYVAICQVLGVGHVQDFGHTKQTLLLSASGTADGGELSLSSQLMPHISELVVPQGVTAIDYISSAKNIAFSGDLLNYGSIYAVATGGHNSSGTISANDIINEPGSIISSMIPSGLAALAGVAPATSHVDLNLSVVNALINAGTISSSGNLSVGSRGSVQTLTITNTAGTMSAAGGQISVHSSGNINLTGGDFAAGSVLFQAPSGAVHVLANAIAGEVSVKADSSNVQVATGDLSLQSVAVKNDPIFVNATGNVNLPATIANEGGPVTVIAAKSILGAAGTGTTIDTSGTSGDNGGAVTLLAGTASVSSGGGITALGPSGMSGDISGITSITATAKGSGAGGAVTMAAYGGGINIGPIDTSTKNGYAGTVMLYAPGNIQVGDITTHGNHLASTYIDIESANPSLGSGIKYDASGNLLQGTVNVGASGGGSIVTGNLDAGNEINDGYRGGNINIVAGGSVTTGSVRSLGGGSVGGAPAAMGYNYGFAGGAGGNISIAASGGSALVDGDLNTSGGGGGGSNVSVGGAGGNGGNVSLTATGNVTVNGPVLSPGGGGGGGSGISSEDTPGGGGSLGNGGGPDSGGLFFSPPPYNGPGQNSFGPTVGNPNHPPFPYPGEGGSNTAYDVGCCGGGYGGSVGNYGNTGSSGSFQKGTFDDTSPHPGGAPGLGGNINISGNSVNITQTIASYYGARAILSPYAGYSVFAHSALGGGQVTIGATGSHVSSNAYSADGDLTSAAQDTTISISPNAVTLSGKTEGNTVIFNGNAMSGSLPAGSFAGTGNGQIQINENGSGKLLSNGEMVTPSELIAAIQVSSLGGQTLALGSSGQAVAGGFAIATQNLPASGFTTLVIPVNVNASFSTPTISVTGSTVISGTVQLQNSTQLDTASLQLNNNASIGGTAPATDFGVITSQVVLGVASSIVANGNISISAPAGSGLQITVPNGASATIGTSASAGGSTGQITLDSGGQAFIIANAGGANAATLSLLGGPVSINSGVFSVASATVLSVNNALTITSSSGQITNNGSIIAVSKSGGGGSVTLQSPGSLALQLGSFSVLPTAAGGGSGGTLNILAPQGQLTISSGSVDLDAVGTASFAGGQLQIVSKGLVVSGSGALAVSANGVGGGGGGQISITNLASQDLVVGAGAISISATGGISGSLSGDGGTVSLSSGGNLYVGMSYIKAGPLGLDGAGASYSFTAGTAGTAGNGNVSITGNIDASGIGTGSGGNILLASNSFSTLCVTSASGNGVTGYLDADAGATAAKGGGITLENLGSGGVTIATNSVFSATAPLSGGGGGRLTVLAPEGSLTVAAASYNFVGSGLAGNGGQINITAQSIVTTGTGQLVLVASGSGAGSGGTVSISLAGDTAPLLCAGPGASDAVNGSIAIMAQSGSQGGDGGHVSLNTGGAVSIDSTAIAFNAQGPNGNGGSLSITAATFTNPGASPIVFDATGHGTGSGGKLNIDLSSQNDLSLSSAGDMQLFAAGGSQGGNGGSVSVSIAGQLSIASDGSGMVVAPQSPVGNGGSISLAAAGLSATSSAPGGAVNGPLIVNASAVGTGNGGAINIALSAGNTINIGTGVGQIELIAGSGISGGNGGSVSVVEKGGNLIIDPSAIAVSALGKNGSGGSLDLTFDNISWADMATSPLVLSTAGKGAGNGGAITIDQTGPVPTSIGKDAGQFTLIAQAGKGGGNGGTIIVRSGGDLSVNPKYLSAASCGARGNGAMIELDAGTAGSGNLLVSGGLSAAGAGKGVGGQITLSAASPLDFSLGGSKKTMLNGVCGSLSTSGSMPGKIDVTNSGGGITVKSAPGRFSSLVLTDGGQGGVLLGSAMGGTWVSQVTINQNGTGNVLSQSSSPVITAATIEINTNQAAGVITIGGIIAGKHGAPSSDTGALVLNEANLILPSAGSVYIKDQNKVVTVEQAGSTSSSFQLSSAGRLVVSGDLNVGGNLTLAAGSSGSILTAGLSGTLNAGSIRLVSGRLGSGTFSQPLLLDTSTLQISGGGSAYLQNLAAAPLSLGACNLSGSLTVINGGDINVTGLVHANAGPINLTAYANGNINSTSAGALRTATLNLAAPGGSIGNLGGLGGSGPLLAEVKTINASALGTVNISNVAPKTNWLNITGSAVNLLSTKGANLAYVVSSAGDIRVTVTSGHLATVTGGQVVATGGSIYLNGSSAGGSITIGAGSFVQTVAVSPQQGNIFVTLGNGPLQTFTGKLPPSLQISTTGSGAVYLGAKGISASGAASNISADDQTVDLDTAGKSAGSIKIMAGSNLIAGILNANLVAASVNLGRQATEEKAEHKAISQAIEAEVLTDQDLGIAGQTIINELLEPSESMLLSYSDAFEENSGRVAFNANVASASNLDVAVVAGSSCNSNIGSAAGLASNLNAGTAANFNPSTSDCATLSGGISYVRPHLAGARQERDLRRLTLSQGNFLIVPSSPLLVLTAHGQVSIAAGSVVLLAHDHSSLAIFDFDDHHAGSVIFSQGGAKTSLRPGSHLTVSAVRRTSFEEINFAQLLGYRRINSVDQGNGRAFSSEFNLLQGISMVSRLSQIASSKYLAARKLSAHLFKTAAIVSIFNAGATFRPSPRSTLVFNDVD